MIKNDATNNDAAIPLKTLPDDLKSVMDEQCAIICEVADGIYVNSLGAVPERFFEKLSMALNTLDARGRDLPEKLQNYSGHLSKAVWRVVNAKSQGQIYLPNVKALPGLVMRYRAAEEAWVVAGDDVSKFYVVFDQALDRLEEECAARPKPEPLGAVSYNPPREPDTPEKLRDEADGFRQVRSDLRDKIRAGVVVALLTGDYGLGDAEVLDLVDKILYCSRGYELVPLLKPLRERGGV